jgi:hypothetical protein
LITSWPGEDASRFKTPTRIAYASENENFGAPSDKVANNKWGFQVDSRHKSYSWTKLLLDNTARLTEFDNSALANVVPPGVMQLPDARDAAGVCEDFLKQLHDHISTKIKFVIDENKYNMTPIEYWITLPASTL